MNNAYTKLLVILLLIYPSAIFGNKAKKPNSSLKAYVKSIKIAPKKHKKTWLKTASEASQGSRDIKKSKKVVIANRSEASHLKSNNPKQKKMLIKGATTRFNNFAINKKSVISNLPPRIEPGKVEIVVDLSSGKVLHAIEPSKQFHPASLTKVMTIYMAFKALKEKKISLDTEITTPLHATKVPPSKIYLKHGEKIKVADCINAIIISSANDAAETMGVALKGSKEKFAAAMTAEAKKLGMHNTIFMNASGLHNDNQKTTAKDLMKLTFSIRRHFPDLYKYFAETSYEYKGKTYVGHNAITANYEGAEGLKTGFTSKSGYNLISVATKNGKTLAALVAGSKNKNSRDQRMIALLDKYFEN